MKRSFLVVVFIMLCVLVGCSYSNERNTEQEEGSLVHNEKPPSLTINVDKNLYKCQHKYVHFRLDKNVQSHSFSFTK